MKQKIIMSMCLVMASLTIPAYASTGNGNDIKVTEASDGKITYVGRVHKENGNVSFDWSGVMAKVKFTGRHLAIRCSDTKANYFNVWIDKEPSRTEDMVIRTSGNDTTIVIADKLGKGEHQVTIQKRTEGEQGKVTIHSFITKGEVLQAAPVKERYIEFVGDSYTCGFGTENSIATDPFTPETENCNLTYATIASRYFDADYTLVCHSGQGVARNYDDYRGNYTMADRYSQTFDENEDIAWDHSQAPVPDLVVIYLGTNDFSTGKQPALHVFTERYKELLGKIRSNYGDGTPILCLAAKQDPYIFEYVKSACKASGLQKISFATLQDTSFNWASDLGACSHPNYEGHRKIASIFIPYMATATGWDMPEKPYR